MSTPERAGTGPPGRSGVSVGELGHRGIQRPATARETRTNVKRKAYISGQITGLTEDEYTDLFGRAEAVLMDMGFEPVSPLKVVACETESCNEDRRKESGEYLHDWTCYMRHDLAAMLGCEYLFTLPNHHSSRGAKMEIDLARQLEITVCHFDLELNTFRYEGDFK